MSLSFQTQSLQLLLVMMMRSSQRYLLNNPALLQVDLFTTQYGLLVIMINTILGTSDVNTHTFRLRFEAIKNSTVECLEKYPQITMATVVYFVTSILGIRVQESDIEHFLESYEKNSSKLFDFLDLYWNYYSYDLLDKLIQRLAANENFESVTKQMEEYKEDMEIFREDTDMEEMFQGEFLSFDEFYALPKGSEKRFLTIACPFIQTLQDLEGVREYLANESSISECALLLKSIGDEFVITWCQIPTDTIDKVSTVNVYNS